MVDLRLHALDGGSSLDQQLRSLVHLPLSLLQLHLQVHQLPLHRRLVVHALPVPAQLLLQVEAPHLLRHQLLLETVHLLRQREGSPQSPSTRSRVEANEQRQVRACVRAGEQ